MIGNSNLTWLVIRQSWLVSHQTRDRVDFSQTETAKSMSQELIAAVTSREKVL